MTRRAFTADPTGRGNLLYRTGDVGRLLPDGSIEFRGRNDAQVKIRGFRVEPGEVRAALLNHEAVEDCAMVAVDDSHGHKELVAYVVCRDTVSSLALRRYLRDMLPDYMIPAHFVQLDAIPLLRNGKVDCQALSKRGTVMQHGAYAPPQRDVEKKMAEIWKQVLSMDQVGLYDNFFDLGGHSLQVIEAVALIEKEFGVEMPFREFFGQTLGQLAASCTVASEGMHS